MSEGGAHPGRVGVRELRQNLSVYLDRVKDGETLVVTEHGHAVARLAPLLGDSESVLDRLIAEGRAWPALGTFADLGPPAAVQLPPGVSSVTNTLLERREEERW